MLVDVFAKGVRGKDAEVALDRGYITANKNAIPFDTNPPMNPSGMRFGSPAVTTRGFPEAGMRAVARLIAEALRHVGSEEAAGQGRRFVSTLTASFPLYGLKMGSMSSPSPLALTPR